MMLLEIFFFKFSSVQICFGFYSDWVSIQPLDVEGARDRTRWVSSYGWLGLHLECRLENEKMSLLFLKYLEATGLLARTGQDLDLFFLIHVHVLSVLHWSRWQVTDNVLILTYPDLSNGLSGRPRFSRPFYFFLSLDLSNFFRTNPNYLGVQDFPENPLSGVIFVYPYQSAVLII